MEPISRRSAMRLAGGTAGAAGLAGASALGGDSLLVPASAAASKKVRAKLSRATYRSGQRMVLRVYHQNLKPGCRIKVTDSSGVRWKRKAGSMHPQVWTAVARGAGPEKVTVTVRWPDGRRIRDRRYRDRSIYRVTSRHIGGALIGMSAPSDVWDQRVREVGAGLGARRIFADLAAGPTSQIRSIEEAHDAGLLPVVSYKVGGDIAGAVAGRYNAVAAQAAARLDSYGLPTAVTFWHEPRNDMTTDQYVAASKQILPAFKRGKLRVGPLLNGFLLDSQRGREEFAQYCPDELFELWDWMGIDTYAIGTPEDPSDVDPGTRVTALSRYVKARGYDLPLGVGEYNGYTAQAIRTTGEALLSVPNVWFGCVWNSDTNHNFVLSGDRLAAFRATLADPRAADPRVSADDRRSPVGA